MCTQESPERKPIEPQIPSILNLGAKNRIVNDAFMLPWDDSPCYPPYTARVCCSGPVTPLDWLTKLYANVVGCSPCSFDANALYPSLNHVLADMILQGWAFVQQEHGSSVVKLLLNLSMIFLVVPSVSLSASESLDSLDRLNDLGHHKKDSRRMN